MTGWGLDRWHSALARAGLALLPLTVLAMGASPASAAQTTVSFEGLSVGTEVTSQLHSQGIEFGKEEAFGQNGKPGNCGPPTVGEEAASPKYALLGQCISAIDTLGTFGELVNHPRGTLALQVATWNPFRRRKCC